MVKNRNRAFKRIRLFRTSLHLTLLALTIAALTGCATYSVGKHYRLAKVDREGSLVPYTWELADTLNDGYDKPINGDDELNPDTLAIVLNSGYLRYLDSLNRPEIILFVRTTVRPHGKADGGVVYERIVMSTEDTGQQKQYLAFNKESHFPFKDLYVLPPIEYRNQDIRVEVRVVELDMADNERAKQLISAAASVGAVFRPEQATAISFFQTVLTFVTENNRDDIEFQFNFQISGDSGEVSRLRPDDWTRGTKLLRLDARTAQYGLIKTEDANRLAYPSTHLGFFQEGVQYTGAQLFKTATLNIANWPIFKAKEDRYRKWFGRPFRMDPNSTSIPYFNSEGKLVANIDKIWNPPPANRQIRLVDNQLYLDAGARDSRQARLFEDQGYMVLTVDSPKVPGINLEDLKTLQETTDALKQIQTAQLTPEQFGAGVTRLKEALSAVLLYARAKEQFREKIKAAGDDKDKIAAIKKEFEEQKKIISDLITDETKTAFNGEADDWIADVIQNHQEQIEKLREEQVKAALRSRFRVARTYYDRSLLVVTPGAAAKTLDVPVHQDGTKSSPVDKFEVQIRPVEGKVSLGYKPLNVTFPSANDKSVALIKLTSGELVDGAEEYELLFVTQEGKTTQRIVFAESPVFTDLVSEVSGKTLLGATWDSKTKAKLVGSNLRYVRSIAVFDKAGTKTSLEASKLGEKTVVEFTNISDSNIVDIQSVEVTVEKELSQPTMALTPKPAPASTSGTTATSTTPQTLATTPTDEDSAPASATPTPSLQFIPVPNGSPGG